MTQEEFKKELRGKISRVQEAYPRNRITWEPDEIPHYVVPWEMIEIEVKIEKKSSKSSEPTIFF